MAAAAAARATVLVVLVGFFIPTQSAAHEYYLMPETFTPAANTQFDLRHRLGQKFKGNEMPFIKKWNIRSEVWKDGDKRDARGQDGDRPALKLSQQGAGLMAVIHQSNVDFLTFSSWEKFVKYATKEGLEHALEPSRKGIKPKEKLKEAYARYAKTLISIDGTVSGKDTPTGLKIELMALAHPLELAADQPMPVQLLYDGKPLHGARVKVFVGVGNEFTHQIRTDKNGRIDVPADGPGPYLLNAIHMTEPQGEVAIAAGAHWESFWATLTFQRAE